MAELSVEGLEVVRGARRVLMGIDMRAPASCVTCVLGPNGAGKSTLLHAIAGLVPYRGRIELDGRNLRELDVRERARMLAYVPQRSLLEAPLPVERVVAQGRFPHTGGLARSSARDRKAIADALERTDVLALAGRRFDRLSSGERRRVLIARALATEAPILLLDEPTAALDVRHALELLALLRALAGEGRSVVIVLHALEEARRHTDRAILLCDGALVASGSSSEILDRERVHQVYGVEMRENGAPAFLLEEAP